MEQTQAAEQADTIFGQEVADAAALTDDVAAAGGVSQDAPRKKRGKGFARWMKALIFIGPHLLFFCVFFIVPFFYGIIISFTRWDFMTDPEWVWFSNYANILSAGTVFFDEFFRGLRNTLIYTVVMVPLLIIVPLLLAIALKAIGKGQGAFQAILYAPSLLSVATVCLTWRWLLDRELGAINNIFMTDINWAGEQPFAWISIFILTLWSGVGGNLVIFLAGLSGISPTYYEAADIDGANAFVKFRKITLPEMSFQLLYTMIMGTIGGFNVFGQPFMFGGPEDTTTVLMMYIQERAFGSATPMAGMASAMSVLLGIIISAFSAVQFKLMNRKDA